MKEIEEDQRNGKTFHAQELEKQILLKCLCYLEQSIFNAIPIKIPSTFHRVGTNNPKIFMEPEKT